MDSGRILQLLENVRDGAMPPHAAMEALRNLPYEDLGFARIDHHRSIRHGFPEVVFGRGKTPEQTIAIAGRILDRASNFLVTHGSREVYEGLAKISPDVRWHEASRCISRKKDDTVYGKGTILVITAGTADIPVADEAVVTAEVMGNRVDLFCDVGVAGIHRLLEIREKVFQARVIIAVAGMEGALPSVVGGMASCPVIAVPTSVGYGVSFGGVAALLGMLNSCASNVVTVNIDNGFGAGYSASLINRL